MDNRDIDALRDVILGIFPELSSSTFTVKTQGWDSIAVDVDDRLIFKFPRHDRARHSLLREAAFLDRIAPAVTMPVPRIVIHEASRLFSSHEKLKGEYLLSADYAALPQTARRALAEDLGRFYAELHCLDDDEMITLGALPIEPWQEIEAIRTLAIPALPADLQAYAKDTLAAFEQLSPDPYGTTYGFFDGHGWNMAFDHPNGRLNGIYDFADSGIGSLHQEFVYSNFIAKELTYGIIDAYEALTHRNLDRRRIDLLTAVHRLSELAELANDPEHAPAMLQNVADWAAQ